MTPATDHQIDRLPVLVVFPHNRCNCRCAMCDIWRIREKQEVTADDIGRQLDSIRQLGVEWIVFSGGEAQLHSDLRSLAQPLRDVGIRLSLLTAGLLLRSRAEETAELFDDVIVSLDGPAPVHDAIRRVPQAFERLAAGVARLRGLRPEMPIGGRCTVQKLNHCRLRDTVAAARAIGLKSISFLAADTTSATFNRESGWTAEQQQAIGLNVADTASLATEVERLILDNDPFIQENPAKLRRIVDHFRAAIGELPACAPRCNAPWVSAVIEADGAVRPCFFHQKIGNIHERPLLQVLNSDAAIAFRAGLDVASNPICQRCVCSLYMPVADRAAAHAR